MQHNETDTLTSAGSARQAFASPAARRKRLVFVYEGSVCVVGEGAARYLPVFGAWTRVRRAAQAQGKHERSERSGSRISFFSLLHAVIVVPQRLVVLIAN